MIGVIPTQYCQSYPVYLHRAPYILIKSSIFETTLEYISIIGNKILVKVNAKNDIRLKLERALLNKKKSLMWSYDLSKKNIGVSDKVLIEKYLEFGNPKEWNMLKQVYSSSEIKEIWYHNMLGFGADEKRQKNIISHFFDAINPSIYLKNERKNKLREDSAWSF